MMPIHRFGHFSKSLIKLLYCIVVHNFLCLFYYLLR